MAQVKGPVKSLRNNSLPHPENHESAEWINQVVALEDQPEMFIEPRSFIVPVRGEWALGMIEETVEMASGPDSTAFLKTRAELNQISPPAVNWITLGFCGLVCQPDNPTTEALAHAYYGMASKILCIGEMTI